MKRSNETILELDRPENLDQSLGAEELLLQGEANYLAAEPASALGQLPGVVIGSLRGFAESGAPLVEFPGNHTANPVQAKPTVELLEKHIGCEVVLMFEQGDPQRPIILGVIHPPAAPADCTSASQAKPVEVKLDGQQLVLSAEQEIVLRCGQASITLTRAGKVLIRGAYLLSRSSGVNRIKGGSVQIN
jgi:hypothetical protein